MVFFGAAAALFLTYLLPLYLRRVRTERDPVRADVFSPELFLCGIGMLHLPYLVLLGVDRSYASIELRTSVWVRDLESTVLAYAALTGVGFVVTLAGLHSRWAGWLASRLPALPRERFTPRRVRRGWIVGGVAGVALYLYFIQSIGGLANLWAHLYLRTSLTQGMGYLASAYAMLLNITAVLAVYSLRDRPGRSRALVAAIVVLGVMVLMGSTGGRSPIVTVLILAMLTHHFGVRRRKRLLTPLTAVLGVLMVCVVLVAPLFRRNGALERYSVAPHLVVNDVFKGFASVAPEVSGFDRVAVMLNYFTVERVWWGKSYVDLVYAPIPRTLFPNKPPVDDGVYFKEIADGRQVVPSRPAREMQPTSWPMGTFVTYMNFWIPGFLAASFLMGVAIGAAYRYMGRMGYAPSSIFLYQFIVMGGAQLSVYGIVTFLTTISMAGLVFWTFFAPKGLGMAGAPALAARGAR